MKKENLTRELESCVSGGVAHAGRGVSPISHVRLGTLSLTVNHSQAQTQTLSVGLSPGKVLGVIFNYYNLFPLNLFLIYPLPFRC